MHSIPDRITQKFIHLETTLSGSVIAVRSGNFAVDLFKPNSSIYIPCSFLETTLDYLPEDEKVILERMTLLAPDKEYDIDIELVKSGDRIEVIMIDRTDVYVFFRQIHQDRNELYLVKSELARQNKELERLEQLAKKANEQKSRFLAIMSHEVRNPLNAILGYSALISNENSDEKIQQPIQSLIHASKNLKVIVNDILDLSRIDAGKLQLHYEVQSISEIIKSCIQDFNLQFQYNNVKIRHQLASNLPTRIMVDDVRVTQIISNLLNNALKFTNKGHITIAANCLSKDRHQALIQICVIDTGRGMTPEQVEKIFKEYEQVEKDDARVHGGAGLGLSIVKRLIKSMNGSIRVESELGEGSSFIVEIPFNIALEEKAIDPIKPLKLDTVDFSNLHILLTDDDELNQVLVQHMLSKENIQVSITNDGLEALALLKNQTFDLVLLDINMPHMSGEELVTQRYLFKEFNNQTPLVALTGNASKEAQLIYLSLGFSAIITKPFTADKLKQTIAQQLFPPLGRKDK